MAGCYGWERRVFDGDGSAGAVTVGRGRTLADLLCLVEKKKEKGSSTSSSPSIYARCLNMIHCMSVFSFSVFSASRHSFIIPKCKVNLDIYNLIYNLKLMKYVELLILTTFDVVVMLAAGGCCFFSVCVGCVF
jgi:hypothetical protein